MKKIFGDTIVSKLRTVPSFAWVIFLTVSFFFAHAYEILIEAESVSYTVAEIYKEAEINFNITTLGISMAFLSTVFYTVIFEFIIAISYNWVAGRFRCRINREDYKFRLRYFMIIVNVIIGVLSIGYFFTQVENGAVNPNIVFFQGKPNSTGAENPYYFIQSAIVPFVVPSVFVIFFYEDFRKRFVPPRTQSALFARYGLLYVGLSALVFIIQIFRNFLIVDNGVTVPVYQTVAYSLQGFTYAAIGIIYYLYCRKLKKIDDNPFTVPTENNDNNKKENVFDDFGF